MTGSHFILCSASHILTVSHREIVRAVRAACGPDFIIVYRLSMLDLVKDGSTWPEIVQLGKAVETAGATIINTFDPIVLASLFETLITLLK